MAPCCARSSSASRLGLAPPSERGSRPKTWIAAPPVIVSAVFDALAELGVTHIDMPLGAVRVWRAIQDARRSGMSE